MRYPASSPKRLHSFSDFGHQIQHITEASKPCGTRTNICSQCGQSEYFVMAALSRRSVGIDAALDLGDAFVVAVNHAGDCDRAADEDGADRNQQTTQAQNRVDYSSHSPPAGAKARVPLEGP